jgi:hypothetical protein
MVSVYLYYIVNKTMHAWWSRAFRG